MQKPSSPSSLLKIPPSWPLNSSSDAVPVPLSSSAPSPPLPSPVSPQPPTLLLLLLSAPASASASPRSRSALNCGIANSLVSHRGWSAKADTGASDHPRNCASFSRRPLVAGSLSSTDRPAPHRKASSTYLDTPLILTGTFFSLISAAATGDANVDPRLRGSNDTSLGPRVVDESPLSLHHLAHGSVVTPSL